jgi:hypothetical protein
MKMLSFYLSWNPRWLQGDCRENGKTEDRCHAFLLLLVNSWAQERIRCFQQKQFKLLLHERGPQHHIPSQQTVVPFTLPVFVCLYCCAGAWTRGLQPLPTLFFFFFWVMGFFEIGSLKLFAGAGFEPQSSDFCLQVARITGMSHQSPVFCIHLLVPTPRPAWALWWMTIRSLLVS